MTELLKVLIKSCKNEHKDSSEGDFFFHPNPSKQAHTEPKVHTDPFEYRCPSCLSKGEDPNRLIF